MLKIQRSIWILNKDHQANRRLRNNLIEKLVQIKEDFLETLNPKYNLKRDPAQEFPLEKIENYLLKIKRSTKIANNIVTQSTK